MNLSRTLAITRKQFQTLRHDKRTLALMLIAPVMAMLIFGFAFGSGTKHVPVLLVNKDKGGLAEKYVKNLDSEILDITKTSDLESAKAQVKNGEKVAVLYFPETFTVEVLAKQGAGANVQLFIDTTNQQLAAAVQTQIPQAAQKTATTLGAKSNISIDTQYAFPEAKDATSTDTLVPGIMAFAITVFTTLITLLAFVGERTSGTLSRLRITPATEAEIVLGYEIAFGLIATLQGTLILSIALLVYHILVVGPLAVAALIVILTAIDAQAIGIVISAAAKRESQAVQFIPFIILPTFLLSGIFVSVQSLPKWLQPFSYILPPTWSIQALRDVLLRGWGLTEVWPQLLVLLAFAVVFTLLAILGLKRSKI